jgi:RNA polymerase primary sigma factor
MVNTKKDSLASERPRGFEGDPILATYLGDIATSTPLDSGAEADLARRIRCGDEEARNTLVEANLRFVVSVAKDYQRRGLSLSELISAGNVGLITAAERFDETRGFKFISYAVWWIRQSILQTLMEQSTVRMPVNRRDMMAKISRTQEMLQKGGKRPTVTQIAEVLGFTEEEVEQALVNNQPVRSLDAPFEDGEGHCMMDRLCDEDGDTPEEFVLKFTLTEDIAAALDNLSGREAEILRLYFGLAAAPPMTLDQIGTRFRLTRERVRQIKEIALSKLRHPRLQGLLRIYADN